MAETVGILGQIAPGTAEQVLTTGPAEGSVLSSLVVCNQTAGAVTFRVRVARSGEPVAATKQYIFYDNSLAANSSALFPVGICLGDGDSIYCLSSSASVSFTAFGLKR